ncbi:MAG: pantetheine-phosphate adenylyltransferase [Planctomycetota bacterium]
MSRHALFPGTFDPFTRGHEDLVVRAARLFGKVTVAVAQNPEKQSLFSAEERAELARGALSGIGGVSVTLIPGLVVQACEDLGADVIVRGVRSGTDFDFEVQMARMNRGLLPRIDTVLLAPAPELAHVSSTLVRQIASMGGDCSGLVPPNVVTALRARFPRAR